MSRNLRIDVHVLSDVLRTAKLTATVRDSVDESFEQINEHVAEVQELVDVILSQHREYHTEASPRFCTLTCQLAESL